MLKFLPFLRFFEAIFGVGFRFNIFLGPTNVEYQQPYLFILIQPHLGLFLLPFWVLLGNFWVGVRFKNFFLTILYRQSTLVLKVQPYLLFSIRPYLGPLLDFFGPLGAFFGTFLGYFWGQSQVQKHFWNLPT